MSRSTVDEPRAHTHTHTYRHCFIITDPTSAGYNFYFAVSTAVSHSVGSSLTITGEGERLSEVLTDDVDLHTDPQTLMQLLLTDRRRPNKARVLGTVAVRVR